MNLTEAIKVDSLISTGGTQAAAVDAPVLRTKFTEGDEMAIFLAERMKQNKTSEWER